MFSDQRSAYFYICEAKGPTTGDISSSVPSKATLEVIKLILHCTTKWKFFTIGSSTSITLVLLMIVTVSFATVNPKNEPREDEPDDVTKPRQDLTEPGGKFTRTQSGQFNKC